jgi:hypothetical protein
MNIPSGIDDTHCSETNTKQGNSTSNLRALSKLVGTASDDKAMVPEALRTLTALRYAQSPEARGLAPFEATLGEIDCLADLIFNHGLRLEKLCPTK